MFIVAGTVREEDSDHVPTEREKLMQPVREIDLAQYRILHEPFYEEVCGEVGLFTWPQRGGCRSCSRDRPVAGKPDLFNTWRTSLAGR